MKKQQKQFTVVVNGTEYREDSKCPACSSERDKGGRLKIHKRVRQFLRCNLCHYSILSSKTREHIDRRLAKMSGMKY